jgi:DNA-binding GntR family transcriptional regulator
VTLGCRDLAIEPVALEADVATRLGVEPGAVTTRVSRVVLADGAALALMVDTLHPAVALPPEPGLRRAIERGDMVLDVLLAGGLAIAYSTTSITARLLRGRDRAARLLGVRATTAVLHLDELFHDTSGQVTHHSSDLFTPEGLDLRVVRWMDVAEPMQVTPLRKRGAA